MLLADRSRLAANTARRTNGNRTELKRGVYSPCDLCRDDPSAPPMWQLKAREIDHDKELQLVEFRDAVMEIDGWPVFYYPLHLDARPFGKARQRLSDAFDRELQHARRACDDPLFPGARAGQGCDASPRASTPKPAR